jgi:DNA-binding NarL/FixJ family response regulator
VILDLMLPDGDGAELLGELASARPPTRVIIFSARDSALPESAVILRRLVKSQHGGTELASLVQAQLRHWPHRGDNGT